MAKVLLKESALFLGYSRVKSDFYYKKKSFFLRFCQVLITNDFFDLLNTILYNEYFAFCLLPFGFCLLFYAMGLGGEGRILGVVFSLPFSVF